MTADAMMIIAAFPYTAEYLAYRAGVHDGYNLGLEYGHEDDPEISYPPMPTFASEAERDAYVAGHIDGYVDGAFDADKKPS